MPATVDEKFESRLITTGANPAAELRYAVRGTDDDVEARAALEAASPALYDPWGSGLLFLPRESITIEPVGEMLWEGIVRYSAVPQTTKPDSGYPHPLLGIQLRDLCPSAAHRPPQPPPLSSLLASKLDNPYESACLPGATYSTPAYHQRFAPPRRTQRNDRPRCPRWPHTQRPAE